MYNDLEGQYVCKLCKKGTYYNLLGGIQCIDCEKGTY